MVKNIYVTAVLTLLMTSGAISANCYLADAQTVAGREDRDFAKAMEAFDKGMYERAMTLFDDIVFRTGSVKAEGYSVLCSVKSGVRGWENRMESFISANPSSELVPQLKFALSCRMFDKGDYKSCAEILNDLKMQQLRRSQYDQYLFNQGFSLFSLGDYAQASERFSQILSRRKSGYTAPAAYILGYIEYENAEYGKAEQHFLASGGDSRFAEMASYYVLECRFLAKDYGYVIENGPELYRSVPEDRKLRLGRMISEAYLIRGDSETALRYYNPEPDASGHKSRTDLFFGGSVFYAEKDYKGAIENFSAMENRTDSLGQIANYQLGWSYLQTGNKVLSMEAFRDAASCDWDGKITEDALFNSAKLSFDINSDARPFRNYIKKYPRARTQEIYSYMALAELCSGDWQAAVDAYDNVDDLSPEMERNYVKANYLRARQLVAAGAYRDAVPLLKTVTFYSDRHSEINQMAKYWLAELQYRNGEYADAILIFKELYHTSALSGTPEGELIPYNIAYSFFRLGDLAQASKWFGEFADGNRTVKSETRKDALTRIADCLFLKDDYLSAAGKYAEVAQVYYDPDDVYPYLQAGMAYGLAGRRQEKTACLEEVKLAVPAVGDYAVAMLELGRCHMDSGNVQPAAECFEKVISSVKDSSAVAQALLEMAMLERNSNNTEKSLQLYRRVVGNMSGSEYADNALLAIENICRAEGLTDDYMAYIDSLGLGESKSPVEKEDFYFSSAQQLYFDARNDKAVESLGSYLEKFPAGRYVLEAKYCMAECLRMDSQFEKACDLYEAIIEAGESPFRFASMQKFADLSYALERYRIACMAYTAILNENAIDGDMRQACLVGQMRSAFKSRQYELSEDVARKLCPAEGIADSLRREALYIRAKSLLSLSRRDDALALFAELAVNPSDEMGAEARYLLIKDKFDRADFKSVENMVYEFSESGTAQNRYLAASFLLLGDVFAEQGLLEQAKATFESVRDGYVPESASDDIPEQVKMRLDRINQMKHP
ncbi:MAG: tetratricopeptide repeat protein [Candidatus Cryptobacteroides sp.]